METTPPEVHRMLREAASLAGRAQRTADGRDRARLEGHAVGLLAAVDLITGDGLLVSAANLLGLPIGYAELLTDQEDLT